MDPKVMVGKPVIRGTRIPVELIVRMLAQGIPESAEVKGVIARRQFLPTKQSPPSEVEIASLCSQ
ncbi:MAG: DUF433 domain-containing protein [Chloroflexota bacterium]